MQSTDAATGNFVSVREHYDRLIAEGNDPVLDPPALKAYMDGWDGDALLELLDVRTDSRVLEIGVGTGRLALRVMEKGCAAFTGMDVSAPTLDAAAGHLDGFCGVTLLKGAFPEDAPEGPFDRIYSSLTFLHIRDKRAAAEKIAGLLAPGGRAVISLDKERSDVLDMGVRQVRTWPDEPEAFAGTMRGAGLCVDAIVEIERAWLIVAVKC